MVTKSVAIKFDLYNNEGEGNNSTGLFINGANPTAIGSIDLTPSGLDLHGGDPFNVQIAYDGITLAVTIKDAVTGKTASQNDVVNIPAIVGGGTAYVGFTAATGGLTSVQRIVDWTFTPAGGLQAPPAPTAFTASASGTSVILAWSTGAPGLTGFHLDRATDAAFSGNLITQSLGMSASTYVDTGLSAGTTYYYRIRAVNPVGDSGNSNTASVTLAAAPTVNFANGFAAATGLTLNGSSAISGTALQLTNGGKYQAASAFTSSTVSVAKFTTSFDFQLSAGASAAHGFTFTLQGQGSNALGQSGGGLGYGNDYIPGAAVVRKSVAVKFDLYNNEGEGSNSTGLFINGANPTYNPSVSDLTSAGVDLHGGDIFNVMMSYDGMKLSVTIKDTLTLKSATQIYAINIPSMVGGNTAYVGFTAGTGGATATQKILDWTYTALA